MTNHATPAEAAAAADELLAQLLSETSTWDRAVVRQAVLTYGRDGREFSMNDLRDLLPEVRNLGALVKGMATAKLLIPVGFVRSTAESTHGKHITVYVVAATRNDRRAA